MRFSAVLTDIRGFSRFSWDYCGYPWFCLFLTTTRNLSKDFTVFCDIELVWSFAIFPRIFAGTHVFRGFEGSRGKFASFTNTRAYQRKISGNLKKKTFNSFCLKDKNMSVNLQHRNPRYVFLNLRQRYVLSQNVH